MSMEDMLAAVVRIKGLQQDLPMHPSATTWAPDALAAIVLAMASEDYKFVPKEIQNALEAIVAVAPNNLRTVALEAINTLGRAVENE